MRCSPGDSETLRYDTLRYVNKGTSQHQITMPLTEMSAQARLPGNQTAKLSTTWHKQTWKASKRPKSHLECWGWQATHHPSRPTRRSRIRSYTAQENWLSPQQNTSKAATPGGKGTAPTGPKPPTPCHAPSMRTKTTLEKPAQNPAPKQLADSAPRQPKATGATEQCAGPI